MTNVLRQREKGQRGGEKKREKGQVGERDNKRDANLVDTNNFLVQKDFLLPGFDCSKIITHIKRGCHNRPYGHLKIVEVFLDLISFSTLLSTFNAMRYLIRFKSIKTISKI